MDTQSDLFVYLLPATLTLVAAVIQTRVQTPTRSLFRAEALPTNNLLQKVRRAFPFCARTCV